MTYLIRQITSVRKIFHEEVIKSLFIFVLCFAHIGNWLQWSLEFVCLFCFTVSSIQYVINIFYTKCIYPISARCDLFFNLCLHWRLAFSCNSKHHFNEDRIIFRRLINRPMKGWSFHGRGNETIGNKNENQTDNA